MADGTRIDRTNGAMAPGIFASASLWSALAFVFHLLWEIAHVRLYTIWFEADRLTLAWSIFHCTLGDVLIALALFALAGSVLQRTDWPNSHPQTGGAMVVTGAIAYTAWSEWYNVYRADNWSYAENMPIVFGIGISPLLQWLLLPPLMMVGYRILAPLLFKSR